MFVFMRLYDQSKWKKRWKIDYIDMTWIDLGLGPGHKYNKYKMCLSMMMLICISNTYAASEAVYGIY